MKKALVLGGGGVVGIAWESGLIAGLKSEGLDLSEAAIIVGTSAGSIVGGQLASGKNFDLPEPVDQQQVDELAELNQALDLDVLGKVFELWSANDRMDRETCAQIGAEALKAKGWSEQQWLQSNQRMHGLEGWPDADLRITSVDTASGELVVHSRTSTPLALAIAASCTVPGMFPTITINGQQHMDGGVPSGTNAQVILADEPDVVIIIAPICARTALFGPAADNALADEISALEKAGAKVISIVPDDTDVEAFGPNLMDPSRADGARDAGFKKGQAIALAEQAAWN